jgi:hypothetical protein
LTRISGASARASDRVTLFSAAWLCHGNDKRTH